MVFRVKKKNLKALRETHTKIYNMFCKSCCSIIYLFCLIVWILLSNIIRQTIVCLLHLIHKSGYWFSSSLSGFPKQYIFEMFGTWKRFWFINFFLMPSKPFKITAPTVICAAGPLWSNNPISARCCLTVAQSWRPHGQLFQLMNILVNIPLARYNFPFWLLLIYTCTILK